MQSLCSLAIHQVKFPNSRLLCRQQEGCDCFPATAVGKRGCRLPPAPKEPSGAQPDPVPCSAGGRRRRDPSSVVSESREGCQQQCEHRDFIALTPLPLRGQHCSLRLEPPAALPCPAGGEKSPPGPVHPPKRSYPFSISARRWLSVGRTCSGGTAGSSPCPAARSRKPCMPAARAAR